MRRILDLPLLVQLIGLGALTMLVPAIHAYVLRDLHVARVFFYGSVLFLVLATLLGIATYTIRPRRVARGQLISLVGAYVVLPVLFAIPFREGVANTTFLNAWFEMVSCFTTTGATLYPDPGRFGGTLHLWRGLVGWLGGFFTWVVALALLAPMNLGGFEVRAGDGAGQGAALAGGVGAAPRDAGRYVAQIAWQFLPIYSGLTAVLWLILILSGANSTPALIHAMATLSTSGISGSGGLQGAGSGFWGEVAVAAFLVFALSRTTFTNLSQAGLTARLRADHELRLGLLIVAAITLFLVLRHWIGAVETGEEAEVALGLGTLWGAAFTVLSFLTTTGFVSADWAEATQWSGLNTPGILLVALAVIGGGVATTAGGVKLLRVWALYTHSAREVERLVYPSSIGGAGQAARQLRRQGAEIAWIFFMLFAMSIALVSGALALAGIGFEEAMVLTVASLSTTGPLVAVGAEQPIPLNAFDGTVKGILMAAMIIGRLETLALIALLNPDFWRG